MIPLKVHNILDYIIALILVSTPYIFDFNEMGEASSVFMVAGIALALYSLVTKYYYSVAKIIPIGVHMALDVAAGAFVILAPYIFRYSNLLSPVQLGVHFVLGVGAIGLVALTSPKTEEAKSVQERIETSGPAFHHHGHV